MKKMVVLMAGLLFFGVNAFAASGDLIINGNLGVGTTAPTQKLDVNGYVKAQSGICIGNNCTSTLHVSGGLYGICYIASAGADSPPVCGTIKNPASCANTGTAGSAACSCPAGYTLLQLGGSGSVPGMEGTYTCYKN